MIVFLLGTLSLFFSNVTLISILPFIYLVVFLLLVVALYDRRDPIVVYFSPCALMALYVSFFFLLGSLAFKYEFVQLMEGSEFWRYYQIERMGKVTFYILCSICITLLSHMLGEKKFRKLTPDIGRHSASNRTDTWKILQVFSALIFILSILVEIPLPGGAGSFSSIFAMFAAIYTSYAAKVAGYRYRKLIHVLQGVLLIVFFSEDRRLMAFYAFITFFIELFDRNSLSIRFKSAVGCLLILVLLSASIIAMSIYRGVGQFDTKSVAHSFLYIKDYLTSDWAITMLFHNFEGPGTIFHSYNAIDYMLQNRDYQFGSTILKAFCFPIPRSIWDGKPTSMVDQYTSILYPGFREIGGSYVPNFYAETFWNFGFIGGLLFLLVVFYGLNRLYYNRLEALRNRTSLVNVFFLSSYSFLLFLFRGSGFDLFLVFIVIFFLLTLVYELFSLLLLGCIKDLTVRPFRN